MDSQDIYMYDAIVTAIALGDFEVALPLLEDITREKWSRLTFPHDLTPLHYACQHGRVDVAKLLLNKYKYSIERRDVNGCTPLHTAAQYGQLEVFKYLLQTLFTNRETHLQLRVDGKLQEILSEEHRDLSGNTPLHTASKHGSVDIVQLLIQEIGCDPLDINEESMSCLDLAAQYGHLPLVKYLATQHCNLLAKSSTTSLLLATESGHLDVVRFFIEELQCDPNSKDAQEMTLLHQACKIGNIITIKYLVEKQKYDPLHDKSATTPLHVAAYYGHLEVVKYFTIDQYCDPLVVNADNNTPLHLAALKGRLDVVMFLIENLKCDPNNSGLLKRIPLHFASEEGHLNVIKYLVEMQCCDLLTQDVKGDTPLHIAASQGHLEVVMYYTTETEHCCDPLIQNIHGNTPLHLSAHHGKLEVVKFFVSALLCDLNCYNSWKKTSLHTAIANTCLLVSEYLISQKHCNVLSPDSDGITPFLLAVRKGYLGLVHQMMHTHRIDPYTQPDKKALLSAARYNGMLEYFTNYVDPLHQAAINGDMDTIRHYIERVEWSPLVKDKQGNSLLHTAAKHGQLEVVKYLTGYNLEHSQCPVTIDFTNKNKHGFTAQQLAANKGHMHVVSYLRQACSNQPTVKHLALPPSVNILVMGNTGSGKSTLVKALSQDKSIFGKFAQVKGVQPLTAGIIPTTISSQDFGKVSIYDFAGHEEYYASHEMILHQTTQPLVLIAVNTSLSMADIEKQLCYWLSILSNAKNDHAMHVLVIGSHADKTSNACIQEVEQNVRLLAENEIFIVYQGFVHCDCRYSVSNDMSQLRHMLSEVCTSIRLSLSYSDTSFSNRMCTSLMYYLDSFTPNNKFATITINQLQQQIKFIESPSPNLERLTDQKLLVQTCESLSANGHLIFLSHKKDVGKSLLLTDEKTILSKVHACLGRINQSIANDLGMLEEEKLKEILSSSLKDTMDPCLAVKYLLIAQFCTEVTPDQLTSVPHGVNEQATHFFFPNLVLAERPAQLWTSAEEDKYTHLYTWCLRCSNARHFFTPRYLHTLFIQLIKCDTTGNAKHTIWKNGILLVHKNGTRCVIEVTHQVTQLSLVMQCLKSKGHETKLAKQRSLLISLIKSLKSKVCPKLELTEFLLLFDHTSDTAIEIPVSEVACSVVAGLPSVLYYENGDRTLPKHATISELLCFESFYFNSPQILQDIFRNCHSHCPVSKDTMTSLSKSCGELVERLHLESGCSVEDITYKQLYTELAKHSIFTDEDIYVLAGTECSRIKSEQENDNSLMKQDMPQLASPLELVDLYEVNVQLVSVTKWKEFGLALGLSRATLEKIEANNHQGVEHFLTEVLAALLKGQDRPHNSPLNWREVIDTLNSPTLNMRDCAKTLVQKLMRDKDEDNGVPTARDDVSPVDDSVLDSHSLAEVKTFLLPLKHKWFHLGLSLGFSYNILKSMESPSTEDCLTEVLVKWLDQADMTLTRGPPSWRSLAAVLNCPLVHDHDMARSIKKHHSLA